MRVDPTGPRASPLDPQHAVIALEDASDREEIFEVLLRAVRSRTPYAALLSVHTDHLRGRRALADDDLDVSQLDSLRIPRHAVAAFETAITSRAPSVGALATGEPFVDGLVELLGGPAQAALVLPVAIGSRTLALIVAHRGPASLTVADVVDLFPLVAASSPALARVLAARAKVAAAPRPPRAETAYEIEVIIPDAAKLRAALPTLRTNEAWEELADAIRDLLREGMEHGDPDDDEQLELLVELGRIEADRLGRPDRAIDAWRSAQTIDAGDPRALDALHAVFVQQGRWLECVEVLDKQVALADEPARRIELLLELAAIAHERLDDDESAIAAYERILHWAPEHEVATRELEALYSARGQWEPLAALLLDRASRHRDPQDSVAALEAVAQMYEDKIGDLRAAFLVWLAMFRRDPDQPRVLEQLARLGPAADAWDEILAEGTALAEELEAAHPSAAARVWHLVGTWTRDHATSREDAVQALERAYRLAPDDPDTLADLVAVLRDDARWIELTTLLAQRAEREQDLGRRSELYALLGDLSETQLGESAQAIGWYQRALADEPEAKPVLVALHRLYRETLAWRELAELLPRLIDVHEPDTHRAEIVELNVELGSVLADHLGRADDAVRAFNAALALEPTHPAAFQGIARVYHATGQTEALLDATEAELDAATGADRARRYGETASAWHARGAFARAAACWRKALALDPEHRAGLEGLARALRAGEQWVELAATLRASLELATAPGERATLLLELGEVLDNDLDDVEGAIAAYREALAIDAHHRGALDAMARLHDRAGKPQLALEVLQRLLELTTDAPRARADLFQRIGHLHLNARDVANARLNLVQALALDLDNAGAHEGMARVHLQRDEVVAGGEELVRAAQLAASPYDKLRCLADAAWVFRHRLHDTERARQCLHLILELEPDHADAKQALAELLADTQQWETLWPHLEQDVQRANDDPSVSPEERRDIFTRAARCALELDKFATALELYDLACAIDQSPAIQIERAEALYRSKSLDAAAASLQTLALRHAQALPPAQLLGVYRRLAEIHTALGKAAQAQLFHHKVLELDPHHRPTLKDLAELHLARGRVDEAIAHLRAIVESAPAAERVPLLERIGDLFRDHGKNAPRAMSTYLEALELEPGNHRLLQRVLDLQSEAGQWRAAAETIGRFLDHETDPARRGAYHLALAEIRRTELRDKPGALEAYDHALDELLREEPLAAATRARALETFRIVDELVTADKNWKYQEQCYGRMLERMPKGDPALVVLWHALGEVYRTRLKQYQSAIEAFEVAHSLDPDKSPERTGILAELYALIGAKQPQQVSERAAKLVEVDPNNSGVYRMLGRSSLEAGRLDEAWCVARALVFLKKANAEEQALYQRYQLHETRKAAGVLDEESWASVRHPDEDRTISAIFGLTWEGPVALRAGPAKAFELKAKDRMPVEDGTRVIAKIFRHASRVLQVAVPDVYVQPRRSGRLLLANCVERGRLVPAVIVGRDLMTGYRDTEIAASVGAMLMLLRPAYYLKVTLPTVDELEAALGAAAQLVGRTGIGRAELEPLRTAFASEMQKRLTRQTAATLHALVSRLPDKPDLARWRTAVDIAAQRAGLLVCGELAAAARMLATEASPLGGQRPNQRVHDLVSYSVSPGYFAARAHLGVTVG